MKRQLNYELLQFHIREASEELDDLLRRIEFSMKLPPGVSEGRINRRRERKLEDAQFVRHEKFPRAFDRFCRRNIRESS